MRKKSGRSTHKYAYALLYEHFGGVPAEEIVTTARTFPIRVRADLQRAFDDLFSVDKSTVKTVGLHAQFDHETLSYSNLLREDHYPILIGPLQFVEVDIGEDRPIRCLKSVLWLLGGQSTPHALLLSEAKSYGQSSGIYVEVAFSAGPHAEALSEQYFSALEDAVAVAGCYRGKVLSLETGEHYTGKSTGVLVHKLHQVEAEDIILPQATLDLLERNVFGFFAQRENLARLHMSVKKGLLFYGPPGTGKTHTIHYLASKLEGHTTLLVTAEQMGLLGEYMMLARLLQPSIVVIEDADLIARQREHMGSPCEEVLLNQLLNEMDGLREDAEILFILTTNRPETLEAALASRPGRIDQAIEFPLPDEEGRRKLALLYAKGFAVPAEVMDTIVRRTERASAAFIKELMRRSAQYCLAREETPSLALQDVESAIDELLVSGGKLNASLLGIEVEAS